MNLDRGTAFVGVRNRYLAHGSGRHRDLDRRVHGIDQERSSRSVGIDETKVPAMPGVEQKSGRGQKALAEPARLECERRRPRATGCRSPYSGETTETGG